MGQASPDRYGDAAVATARAEMSQQRPTAPHVRSIPGARRDDIEHRVHEVSHFIQEDRGEVVAADVVAFIQRHQQGFAG